MAAAADLALIETLALRAIAVMDGVAGLAAAEAAAAEAATRRFAARAAALREKMEAQP